LKGKIKRCKGWGRQGRGELFYNRRVEQADREPIQKKSLRQLALQKKLKCVR